jgi:hypothetical protein
VLGVFRRVPSRFALFGLWVVGFSVLGRGWAFLLGCKLFCRDALLGCFCGVGWGFVGLLWVG